MRFALFLITGLAGLIFFSKIFDFDKRPKFVIIVTLLIAMLAASIGAYEGCADGWHSTNIGRSGACSHHGGVETHANIYGLCCAVFSIIVLFSAFKKLSNVK